jgi:hypothetical protein
MNSENATMNVNSSVSTRHPPKSMLLLRRAADAAGYAAVGTPDEEPVRLLRTTAPALVLAGLACIAGFAFAIY